MWSWILSTPIATLINTMLTDQSGRGILFLAMLAVGGFGVWVHNEDVALHHEDMQSFSKHAEMIEALDKDIIGQNQTVLSVLGRIYGSIRPNRYNGYKRGR